MQPQRMTGPAGVRSGCAASAQRQYQIVGDRADADDDLPDDVQGGDVLGMDSTLAYCAGGRKQFTVFIDRLGLDRKLPGHPRKRAELQDISQHQESTWTLLAVAVPAVAADKPAKKATVSETVKLTAAVKAVDYDQRLIALQGQDGKSMTVEASPEVRRLKEIKAGDMVVIEYTQAIAAELKKAGAPESRVAIKEDVKRAKADARPGLTGQREVRATVTVDAIDLRNNIVNFTGPRGDANIVAIKRPQMREFIKTLKPGDKVDVTYTEAVAVSVEPAAKK